jgi:hypothetical protein
MMEIWYQFKEFFWPSLEPLTPTQETAKISRDQQIDGNIQSFKPKKQAAVALDEARRLNDVENERRKSADQKATTYLAFVAAILPLILTVTTAFWDKKAGNVPLWLNIGLLIIAIIYTIRAGKWAFEVLKVAPSHRLGASDFDKAWKQTDPTLHLTQSILQTIRLNEDGTNQKISSIKMTHEFLFRAFIAFFLLLAVNILWPVVELIGPRQDPWLASSQTTLRAVQEIDEFHQTVIEKGVTRERLATWCNEHGLGQLSIISIKPSGAPVSPLAASAIRHARGTAPDAKVNMRCNGKVIADADVWLIPKGQPANIDPMNLIHRGGLIEFGFVADKWQSRSYWPHNIKGDGYKALPSILISESFQAGLDNQKPVALVHVEYRNNILQLGPDFAHRK